MKDSLHKPDRRFCVAPMMRHSHGAARRLWRELCPGGMVYTEMVVADAVLRGDRRRLLGHAPEERPLGLQLGGNDPAALAQCALLAEEYGYAEVNVNAGCPSGRVRQGNFGACLMRKPDLVADCVRAMKDACSLPATVKVRTAVDELDPESCLSRMAASCVRAGADALMVHARKAWTKGLDPKGNRTIPPLDHARVHRLKREFPELEVIVNGGITDISGIRMHLEHVDGVMCGREIVRNPLLLAEVAEHVYGHTKAVGRREIVRLALALGSEQDDRQWPRIAGAMHGLARGMPNGRLFRRALSKARSAADALSALERLGFA